MCSHHEWSMIGVQCQLMICREHIRASKDALQIFLWLMVLCNNWHFKSNFALLSSFWLWFQRIKNGFGCFYLNHFSPLEGYFYMRNNSATFLSETASETDCFHGAFPLPDSDSYSDYCTDSNSMQKCSTGLIPMVIPMQITDTR